MTKYSILNQKEKKSWVKITAHTKISTNEKRFRRASCADNIDIERGAAGGARRGTTPFQLPRTHAGAQSTRHAAHMWGRGTYSTRY
jgi:hypothetical protein